MFNIGATDAVEGATVKELKERIASTVRELQVRGFIVLLARMPMSLKQDWNRAMEIQQQAVRELWKELPGVLPGADLARLDPDRHVNRIDKVHLNAAGYRESAGSGRKHTLHFRRACERTHHMELRNPVKEKIRNRLPTYGTWIMMGNLSVAKSWRRPATNGLPLTWSIPRLGTKPCRCCLRESSGTAHSHLSGSRQNNLR